MAVVNIARSFNMLEAQDWGWVVTEATTTSMVISDGVHTQTFAGSFSYDGGGNVSGTVTATSYYVSGALVFAVTGIAVSAAQMQIFAETAGDTQATYAYVLAGADAITGSSGNDVLLGYSGSDRIDGRAGNDRIYGGSGNDRLIGGLGIDTLVGGIGNDVYYVDNRLDRVAELASAGTDSVVATVSYTLAANVERLTLAGTSAINGNGNTLANVLTGNAAANALSGGSGNDAIAGAAGNDVLAGGAGNDLLSGGAGLDSFRFDTALSATTNVDRIADFSSADDRFQLDDAVFAGIGAPGLLASGAFRAGAAAGDAGDRVIYHAATGQLFYDSDGTGSASAVLFATVTPNTTIVAGDFYII